MSEHSEAYICVRFRWVSLQLQFLRTLKRADTIWKRLGELPKDLRDIYDDIYRVKIEGVEEQGSIAKNAFNLLLSLQTPLKHEEFLQALSFCGDDKTDVSAEDLLDFGCNFLVLDAELDVFRFAHLSVREYLDTRSEYGPECSYALAAQFCLRHLCTSNPSGPFLIPRDHSSDDGATLGADDRIMSWRINPAQSDYYRREHLGYRELGYPFLDPVHEYACAYWADHLAGSGYLRFLHPLNDMLRKFAVDTSGEVSPWFMYWNRLAVHMVYSEIYSSSILRWKSNRDEISIGAMVHNPADYLFAASILGFCDLLELGLRSKPDPLFLRSYLAEHNALQLACKWGNRDAAEVLLDRGWGLQVENGFSLLGLALRGSHFETVKLLLSRGADPNEKCCSYTEQRFPFQLNMLPILRAVKSGSSDLVKILLDYGASADVEDHWGRKTFHLAAINDKQEIADLLLAASTDADQFPRSFCRQLFLLNKATRDEDEDLLNTTLENWPQGAQGNRYLSYALWDALYRRTWDRNRMTLVNDTCLEALLAKGADANFSFLATTLIDIVANRGRNSEGRTILSASDFSILQLLVDHGADLGEREFASGPEVSSD